MCVCIFICTYTYLGLFVVRPSFRFVHWQVTMLNNFQEMRQRSDRDCHRTVISQVFKPWYVSASVSFQLQDRYLSEESHKQCHRSIWSTFWPSQWLYIVYDIVFGRMLPSSKSITICTQEFRYTEQPGALRKAGRTNDNGAALAHALKHTHTKRIAHTHTFCYVATWPACYFIGVANMVSNARARTNAHAPTAHIFLFPNSLLETFWDWQFVNLEPLCRWRLCVSKRGNATVKLQNCPWLNSWICPALAAPNCNMKRKRSHWRQHQVKEQDQRNKMVEAGVGLSTLSFKPFHCWNGRMSSIFFD